ncbi:hypothetical protein JCM10449v2_005393 [Rhodotorula kratochvilovae]
MGLLDKVNDFVQGEQGQNLINKLGGSNQNDQSDRQNTGRDESAIKRDDQQSYGGPTSGFDSTSDRYNSSSSSGTGGQDETPSYGGASTGFGGTSERYTSSSSGESREHGNESESFGGASTGFGGTSERYTGSGSGSNSRDGQGKDDSEGWEDDNSRSSQGAGARRGTENAYSSSRGDFSASGAAYGSTATPHYGSAEADADGAFLEDRGEGRGRQEQRNNPFGEGRDEQQGYERGSDERNDSSYGGGDRGLDFVASGGGSAYGDGLNDFGGAGRNNDGAGGSSYEPSFPDQRDGRPGGERDNYP